MTGSISAIPLRVKLVAAVLTLVTAALLIISASSAYFLRSYLVGRIDDELVRYLGLFERSMPSVTSGGLPSDYLVAATDPDRATVEVLRDDRFSKADLPGAIDSAAFYEQHAGAEPFTAGSGSKALRWRVVVGDLGQDRYVAVGQDLSDVDYAVARLIWIDALAGGTVLILLAVAGAGIVRSSLRPLNEIEQTAGAIAAGDLSRRIPDPEPGVARPRSELGRLSRALNAMLAQIESAFTARARSEATARDAATAAQASESRARRSEERMRQFIADASHELRTPLTTIRGFAELYRQGAVATTADTAKLVRRIEDEAARMGLLVEDLLLLARLDQERPVTLAPVDLRVLVADAMLAARASAPERAITTETAPGAGPLVVNGDDRRLRQVLSNLLSNAVTHTPPTATISIALRADDDGFAVIDVHDTGPGLSPEQADRVFERFYRVDDARTRRDGSTSTGLGLAIVAALVAAHGGTVRVDSQPDAGTTFALRLPLTSDEATSD
ncbi:MAG TPA: HAMP domain-containing sensor histidine kinase [Asanoa sp.]|nr:HAMP domain-containing sensor histidine kinase [Asanoa sp.]